MHIKYLFKIPTTLPPFTWVNINCYINRKAVLFPILNYGRKRNLNCGPLDLQLPAMPSELSTIDKNLNFLFQEFGLKCEKEGSQKTSFNSGSTKEPGLLAWETLMEGIERTDTMRYFFLGSIKQKSDFL